MPQVLLSSPGTLSQILQTTQSSRQNQGKIKVMGCLWQLYINCCLDCDSQSIPVKTAKLVQYIFAMCMGQVCIILEELQGLALIGASDLELNGSVPGP